MDYRVKYRDIPWPVAISVLPGKIIGAWIIDPALNFIQNWKRILFRWFKLWAVILLAMFTFSVILAAADALFEGAIFDWLKHIWRAFNE